MDDGLSEVIVNLAVDKCNVECSCQECTVTELGKMVENCLVDARVKVTENPQEKKTFSLQPILWKTQEIHLAHSTSGLRTPPKKFGRKDTQRRSTPSSQKQSLMRDYLSAALASANEKPGFGDGEA